MSMNRVGSVILVVVLCFTLAFVVTFATDIQDDVDALHSLKAIWQNVPPSWTGFVDPCTNRWEGIECSDSRVVSISLSSMGLKGTLSGDIQGLSELQTLDLSYNTGMSGPLPEAIGKLSKLTHLILIGCSFSGKLPDSIGSLSELTTLSLNSNNFIEQIPNSFGNLSKLYWLDLANNKLTGSIPVSNGTTPGLDLLVNTKHFHFGKNQLSGPIPAQLFNENMKLIHLLLDNNMLTGSIPTTLGLVNTLEVLRLDWNLLSGTVPSNINNLTGVVDLHLSNNRLTGLIPDLSNMISLNYLDMSNNSFDPANIPSWFSALTSLTTLKMEGTHLQGTIPTALFSLSQLQTLMMEQTELKGELPVAFFSMSQLETVMLKNNHLNGTLDFGSSYSTDLQLVDLQNNEIEKLIVGSKYNFKLVLSDNPFCEGAGSNPTYCNKSAQDLGPLYSTPVFCAPKPCPTGQTSSSTCECGFPYTGTWTFRAPTFSPYGDSSHFTELQQSLLKNLTITYSIPVASISISDVAMDAKGYLNMRVAIFPSGQAFFNETGALLLGFVFSNQLFKPDEQFGPYVFIADTYQDGETFGSKKKSQKGLIVGAVVGGSVLFLLLLCAGGYAYHQKNRAEKAKKRRNTLVSWNSEHIGGDVQLKGARFFTFAELQKCTNNFSEDNNIGAGGFGKVYKGILGDGNIVAIKRCQEGSSQGSREFKNEIELLSRVHHKNLVKLVGFCYAQGEQMLVYEYIANGTLMDSLSGTSGIQLDWVRRLTVTLGAARGLQYLHELADPPIIHRDIKSTNILLDEKLVAKVADFGLSKLFGDTEKGYVTTQVKGTLGYMDPEYYMTNQVTEKSDVFSFGVVMLEIVTGRRPLQQGKYIVKEIKTAIDRKKDLYNLDALIDPLIASSRLVGLEHFVDLALSCVVDAVADRPTMGDLVKEIESIVKLAGVNPNLESASVSWTYSGETEGDAQHPYNDDFLAKHTGRSPLTHNEAR